MAAGLQAPLAAAMMPILLTAAAAAGALMPMTNTEAVAVMTAARCAELEDKNHKVLRNHAVGQKEWKCWAAAGPGEVVKGVTTSPTKRPYTDLVTKDKVTRWANEHLTFRACHTTNGKLIAGNQLISSSHADNLKKAVIDLYQHQFAHGKVGQEANHVHPFINNRFLQTTMRAIKRLW